MASNVNLNSDDWCELIFEGRNREYGAYHLRKTASKRHLLALLIVCALCTILVLFIFLFRFTTFKFEENIKLQPVELTNLMAYPLDQHASPTEIPPQKRAAHTTPDIVQEENAISMQDDLQALVDSIKVDPTSIEDTLHQQNEMASNEKIITQTSNEQNTIDSIPEFPGGQIELLRYIYRQIQYPPTALKQKISGQVICSFTIDEKGLVSDVALIQGVYLFLDEEVLRVIRSLPAWKPATRNGKTVKIRYYLPVEFRL